MSKILEIKKEIKKQKIDLSLIRKLRRENKITDEFLIMLNNLTLEEMIGVKLELSSKLINGKMYGFKIWPSLKKIVQSAVLYYALSCGKTYSEIASLLGVSQTKLTHLIETYRILEMLNIKQKDYLIREEY